MQQLSKAGLGYMILNVVLWGLTPIAGVLVMRSTPPLITAGLSSLAVALVLLIPLALQGKLGELVDRRALPGYLGTSLFIAIGFYAFYFSALPLTTAGNAALMSLIEIPYSMVFFGLILKHERYRKLQMAGMLLLVLGACTILLQHATTPHLGDLLLLVGFLLCPPGNYWQKQARKHVSALAILVVRNLLVGIVLTAAGFAVAGPLDTGMLLHSLPFIALNGILFLGIAKVCFIESIHLLPVGIVVTFGSLAPVVTLGAAYFLLGEVPTAAQLCAIPVMLLGTYLTVRPEKKLDIVLE